MRNMKNSDSRPSLFSHNTLPFIIMVVLFILFALTLNLQRNQELHNLELRLQLQASLLAEKISNNLKTYEMTIALLDQAAKKGNMKDTQEKDFLDQIIRRQLLLQEDLDGVIFFSETGDTLYSTYHTQSPDLIQIQNIIETNQIQQQKEFCLSPIIHQAESVIVMSKIIYNENLDPHAIIALVIKTDFLFDPLLIQLLNGIRKAILYDSQGNIYASWYNDLFKEENQETPIYSISEMTQFSLIEQLEQNDSSLKGGMRILSLKDVYIPIAQISNFPLTIALDVSIKEAMKAYDKSLYINLVAILFLLIVLYFINQRLLTHRRAKESLQQKMVEELSQQVKERTAELERLSNIDVLTGLMNRRQFDILIERERETHILNSQPFSIIAIDLDEFKHINDTFGHGVGDEVLIHISSLLLKDIGAQGYIARWGGDELMILLPHMKGSDAINVGKSLCSSIEQNRLRNEILCTISIGVAEHIPGEDLKDLIRRADIALYKAKDEGRNRALLAPEPK